MIQLVSVIFKTKGHHRCALDLFLSSLPGSKQSVHSSKEFHRHISSTVSAFSSAEKENSNLWHVFIHWHRSGLCKISSKHAQILHEQSSVQEMKSTENKTLQEVLTWTTRISVRVFTWIQGIHKLLTGCPSSAIWSCRVWYKFTDVEELDAPPPCSESTNQQACLLPADHLLHSLTFRNVSKLPPDDMAWHSRYQSKEW